MFKFFKYHFRNIDELIETNYNDDIYKLFSSWWLCYSNCMLLHVSLIQFARYEWWTTLSTLSLSLTIVIRGTMSKKKFKKYIHEYSIKSVNTFSALKSTYLSFCFFFNCYLSKYSKLCSGMEQKDCQNAMLRRKMLLQERLHARSNKH